VAAGKEKRRCRGIDKMTVDEFQKRGAELGTVSRQLKEDIPFQTGEKGLYPETRTTKKRPLEITCRA